MEIYPTQRLSQEPKFNTHPNGKPCKAYRKGKPECNMPTIKCICGQEILVVPNLKAMSEAIRNHLIKHKHGKEDNLKASVEWAVAEKMLIEQLYEFAIDEARSKSQMI